MQEDFLVKKAAWALALLLAIPAIVFGGDDATVLTVNTNKDAIDLLQTNLNYVWTLIAACLVFFMQAGFAMVESGFTRAKSAVNIMMKNLMDFSMGSIAFWAIGFGIMFGTTKTGWFGTDGFFSPDGVDLTATHGSLPSGCFSVFLQPLLRPSFPVPWPKEQNLPAT